MASSHKIGIDFGTSNSTCAVIEDGRAKLVPLEGTDLTLPSAMFFRNDGNILYGRQSISAYLEGEEGRFMRGLKSILGTSLIKERTLIHKQYRTFTDIIAIYMRNMKLKAEHYVGDTIKDVVIGRPVHFHDNNTEADISSENTMREIAENIGFQNIAFQYEPIAAAFAHEKQLKDDQLALVVDLGGGTSDFTVIRLSPDRTINDDRKQDILATSGVRVGGTNFDQRLSLSSFMPEFGLGSDYASGFDGRKILPVPPSIYYQLSDWPQVNFGQTPKAVSDTRALINMAIEPEKLERLLYIQREGLGHALLQTVEQTKIALTDISETNIDLSMINIDATIFVSRNDFEKSIDNLIERISISINECIEKASIHNDEIGMIILTGGSSELPIINQIVTDKFPKAQISNDNKFGSVGLGLAYNTQYL